MMVLVKVVCGLLLLQLVSCVPSVYDGGCSCDQKYTQHYDAKGCQATQWDQCGCPVKYRCPVLETSEKGCVFRNEIHPVGSILPLRDNCTRCRCVNQLSPRIQCIRRECGMPGPPPARNCHLVYKEGRCCPLGYQCPGSAPLPDIPDGDFHDEYEAVCERGGTKYPVGAKIQDPNDVCLTCHCVGSYKEECVRQDCLLEKDKLRFLRGCTPVYHEKKCCPIEFFCPEDRANQLARLQWKATEEKPKENNQCIFDGRRYNMGDTLPHNNKCVRCRCQYPPDVTCVHAHCPMPDVRRGCRLLEEQPADQCCPLYECDEADVQAAEDNACLTGNCPEHCVSVKPPGHRCYVCVCRDLEDDKLLAETPGMSYNEIRCATTMCDANCVSATAPGHSCSVCACSDSPTILTVTLLSKTNLTGISEEPHSTDYENISSPTFESSNPDSTDKDNELKNISPPSDEFEGNTEISGDGGSVEVGSRETEDGIFKDKETNVVESLGEGLFGNPEAESAHSRREELIENVASEVADDSNELLDEMLHMKDIKRRRRRTSNTQRNNYQVHYQQWPSHPAVQHPQQRWDDNDVSSEREREDGVDTGGDGYDDLTIMRPTDSSATLVHVSEEEARNVVWVEYVPGCPTPLCEGPSCRIGIPPGKRCPTCVCRSNGGWQP